MSRMLLIFGNNTLMSVIFNYCSPKCFLPEKFQNVIGIEKDVLKVSQVFWKVQIIMPSLFSFTENMEKLISKMP